MKFKFRVAPHRVARWSFAFVLLCLTGVSAVADGVDDYVQKLMASRHIPGASVAVIKDGKPVLLKGYGQANVELGVMATENTAYQLASVTKQFTAAAIMMLAEDGKLALDDKLPKFFDRLPAAWSNVTVRQLLNHTSGIRSYTNLPDFDKTLRQDFSKEAILKMSADAPVEFAPGEKYNYNNTGYYLLGMIIEKASGKEYGAFLTERIFQPLGMTATRLNDLRDVINGRAAGYAWEAGRLRNGEYVSPTQPFSAGALISTVVDMAKWDAALYTDKLLKRASLEQMWTPEKLNDGKPLAYGYGWGVDIYRTRKRISHGGGINGFSTFIARFVDDKLTVVVLTNSESGDAGALANGIAEFYIPALAENAPKAIADNDPKLTAFLKEVIASLANGEGNPDWFTPEARAMLFPDRIRQGRQMMGAHGPLNAFELQEDRTEGGVRRRAYKAVFGDFALRCGFTLAADGKIAGVGMRPL
jgi:CubicO group peptidase (beta-lactamase class C family)